MLKRSNFFFNQQQTKVTPPQRRKHTKIILWGAFGGSSVTSSSSTSSLSFLKKKQSSSHSNTSNNNNTTKIFGVSTIPPTELILDNLPDDIDSKWNFVAVAAGSRHIVFLTEEGHLVFVGSNKHGQLGRHTTENVPENEPQYFDLDWRDVKKEAPNALSCGTNYTIAYQRGGEGCRAVVVGFNHSGQLGLGHKEILDNRDGIPEWRPNASSWFSSSSSSSSNSHSDPKIEQIECGYNHTMIQLQDQRVFACGTNQWGELGFGRNITNSPMHPESIPFFDELAMKAKEQQQEKQENSDKNNNNNNNSSRDSFESEIHNTESKMNENEKQKLKLKLEKKIKDLDIKPHLSLGNSFSLFVTKEGRVYGWGAAARGQLPFACQEPTTLPIQRDSRPLLLRVRNISAGSDHSVFVTTSSTSTNKNIKNNKNNKKQEKVEQVFLRGSLPEVGIVEATGSMKQIELGNAKPPFQHLVSHGSSTILIDSEGTFFGVGANTEGQLGCWKDEELEEIKKKQQEEKLQQEQDEGNEEAVEKPEGFAITISGKFSGISSSDSGEVDTTTSPFQVDHQWSKTTQEVPAPLLAVDCLRFVGLRKKKKENIVSDNNNNNKSPYFWKDHVALGNGFGIMLDPFDEYEVGGGGENDNDDDNEARVVYLPPRKKKRVLKRK